MPKKSSGRKNRSKAKKAEAQQQPHPNAMEDIAEEMINGIFCHYEPPDENTRYKGILRKPRHLRVHSDGNISGSEARRRVRWSDQPSSSSSSVFIEAQELEDKNKHNPLMAPFSIVTSCTHEAVEAGVERAERDSIMDYDLVQSFSEDSNGIIRRRESRAHRDVVFDDEGNPVPVKPGAQVDMPPPRPPPKKKETFIPELCGVKIGSEDDERTYNGNEESIADNVNSVSNSVSEEAKNGDGYERPDHSRYRPSWEYTEDDENSIIDNAKARQAAQKNGSSVLEQNDSDPNSMIPPPPPPPPRPHSMLNHPNFVGQANNVPQGAISGTGNVHPDLPNSEEDWVGDESGRSDCSMLFGSNAQDWDQSLAVIPMKRYPDPPKLDAPGSRDSQEENKPERNVVYSPNGPTGEVGTEMKLKSPSSRRRSFFTRGRGRDKRQSLPGKVQVFEEDDKISETSRASQRSFLGLRNRSRSPGRRRMFGRSKSGNDVNTACGYGSVAEDVDKQSFIGAYRDSMSQVDQSMSYPYPTSGFHPAHPLNYGMWMMSKDDAMERQSFITAYRESMEPKDSKVNSITERLRRIRAQKTGSNLTDLAEEVDDEAFERQSMITAHRESFEGKGHPMMQNHSLHRHVSTHEERKEGQLAVAQKETTEMKGKGNESSWEQRTREALERIRCGADESTTLPSPRAEITEDKTPGDETSKNLDNEDFKQSNPVSKSKNNPDQDDSASKVDEVGATAEKLSRMLSCTPTSSNDPKPAANSATATTTPPLKSILKSPGSGKRVSFGVDQERIFHDEQNENQVTPPPPLAQPPKTGSLLGNMLGQRNPKSASPSSKTQGLGAVHTQSPGRSPLLNQSPGQPSPMQGQVPYMYPAYPQHYAQMMPSTSPMNSDQMISPSFASESSMPPAQMPYGWPIPPVPSGDSSQQQSVMSMPPYMAPPPYYYGYPPNYGGFMYPPPPVMQNNEEKKKKKRVFRGRKLLSAVVGKGGGRQTDQSDTVTALGSSTLSSSYSAEGPGEDQAGHHQSMESAVKT